MKKNTVRVQLDILSENPLSYVMVQFMAQQPNGEFDSLWIPLDPRLLDTGKLMDKKRLMEIKKFIRTLVEASPDQPIKFVGLMRIEKREGIFIPTEEEKTIYRMPGLSF